MVRAMAISPVDILDFDTTTKITDITGLQVFPGKSLLGYWNCQMKQVKFFIIEIKKLLPAPVHSIS